MATLHEHDTFVPGASAVLQNILFLSFRRQPDFLSPLHVESNNSKKYQNVGILYGGTVPGKYYSTAMSSKILSEWVATLQLDNFFWPKNYQVDLSQII